MKKLIMSAATAAITVLLVFAGNVFAVEIQFDPAVNYVVGNTPRSVAVADFDGGAGNDLAVVNYLSFDLSILLNNGDGTFASDVRYSLGAYPTCVFAADLDGINGPDLAVTNANNNDIWVLLNNGDGTFAAGVSYAIGSYPYSVFAADLDGDTDLDLAAANNTHSSGGSISILLNNGNGTFATAVDYTADEGPVSVSLVDLDGDYDNDLAVVNGESENVSILLNNGNATFGTAVNYDVGDGAYCVTFGDFDGDTDYDLATANTSSDDVSVLLNNGNGTFATAVDYGAGSDPRSVVAADFDGDNDLDLATANIDSDDVSILLNLGNGTFAESVEFDVGNGAWWLAAGDLDGDDDSDLAVTNYLGANVSVLMNTTELELVVINEILYQPGDIGASFVQHDHEWVELYNTCDSAIDLTGWTLSNRSGTAGITLPSWTLPVACFLTVHLASGTDDSDFGDFDGHYYTGSAVEIFDDYQDECALYRGLPSSTTIEDFVSWSSQGSYIPDLAHDHAVSAGIWTADEYYDSQGLGTADCLARFFDGFDRDVLGDWRVISWELYVYNQPLQPENPIQEAPRNRSITIDHTPMFEWAYFADADSCQLQVDNNWDFSATEIDVNGLVGTDYTPVAALADGVYYWRLRAYVNGLPTPWAAEWMVVLFMPGVIDEWDPLDAPFKWQRKDTELLCLWNQKESTRPGCVEIGNHAWDKPHPDGPPPSSCPHCNTYCVRASVAMLSDFYGGNMSQDRISYHIFANKRVEPEGDLGHGKGTSHAEISDALEWALNITNIPYEYRRPGGFSFNELTNWIDERDCYVATVPGHAVVIDAYEELIDPMNGTLIQIIGVQDPALGPDHWTVFSCVDDFMPVRLRRRHRTNNFNAVWLQPQGAIAPLDQEDVILLDSDVDGIKDFDEMLPRALDCLHTKMDSDDDEVDDKVEIRNYTFHDKAGYHPGHENDDRDFPDIDGDGKRAENDCDSDDDSEFDGGEDINGDGFNPVPAPGDITQSETCQFDDGQFLIQVSTDKDVYESGEDVLLVDNIDRPTHTYRGNSSYNYEMAPGIPNKVDGDAISWDGDFQTNAGGHAIDEVIMVCNEPGPYYLYVDVLSDERYSEPDNWDPFTSWVCLPIPGFHISIDFNTTLPGQWINITIKIRWGEWFWEKNISFDFLISYGAEALSFMEATPGQLLEDCGWEYFTYRYGANGNCGDACPSGLLRIVAIADVNNGPSHPSCYGPPDDDEYQLAEMSFMVSENPAYQGTTWPLTFFWGDCEDNTVTDITGDIMHVDKLIYDLEEHLIWDEEDDILFPEGARLPFVGAPDECLDSGEKLAATVERSLVFFNGGIEIGMTPPCCVGRVGDANGIGGDEPTIGDASAMIDAKFITGTCLGVIACLSEADINQTGGADPDCNDITIGDISTLIDYLFITGPPLGLPNCL